MIKWVVLLVLASCADERVLSGPCTTDCTTTTVHPPGFLEPTSPAFHGRELARRNWDFALCAKCHGGDFKGGISGVSCLTCHAAGPTACVTCHAAGPTSNAHLVHAGGPRTVACAECHVVPQRWDDDGHILHDGIAITTPAKVTFGALAGVTLAPADRRGPPSWDGATCSNVYCHGDVLHLGGGLATKPRWDAPTPPGSCDGCHGDPPPNHVRSDCIACHPGPASHINGVVDVGVTCNGCHGSATSDAPPRDLSGNTFTTALGVGAHQAHLLASSQISAPVACATCHLVPASIDAAGHIDAAPAEVTASLGWDRNARTCSNAWCHGTARPLWTSSGQVFCGSCHGIPPTGGSHNPLMTLRDCATCHPGTVDAFGNIIVTNGTSEHMNHVVDHL